MNYFEMTPTKNHNGSFYLTENIPAFCHSDYLGGGQWRIQGTIENIICSLKNDITPCTNKELENVSYQLFQILLQDLAEIRDELINADWIETMSSLVVCVVPRAKVNYSSNQLLFRKTISDVVKKLPHFIDGVNFILRQVDTKTTHRAKYGYGGDGEMPYPGITEDTCEISDEVKGKDILLIDDVYTKTINIDEDAIQALLNKGAKSVVFYAVGKTVSKY